MLSKIPNLKQKPDLINQLLKAEAFPHSVETLEIHETHISWVILTGPFAYKIKKPVTFDFVDYSTLERRRAFCEIEVQLNRRFAPDLYLGVVPISESNGELIVGEEQMPNSTVTNGEQVEYAVKMRQFPQESIVAKLIDSTNCSQPEMTAAEVEQLGRDVASFHDLIECAPPTLKSVQPSRVLEDATDNFAVLKPAFESDEHLALVAKLEKWTLDQYQDIRTVLAKRLDQGMVRRCHGDMHLKNIIRMGGCLVPFDGIEFNEDLQWIDVLSEIAFPVMDFVARGRIDLGWRLLNSYLEATGDYEGLSVLKFYLVYRAMVRAKVTWLNPKNKTYNCRDIPHPAKSASHRVDSALAGPWDKYLKAAHYFAFELQPSLSITHGFSGSGKSTVAMQQIEKSGGIRVRSDSERHRLARKFKTKNEYSREMTEWVYSYLMQLAKTVVRAGLPVIVDATFLKRVYRKPFEEMASRLDVDYKIIDCDAPFEQLRIRLLNRRSDPSEANIEVLEMQMKTHEPLTANELSFVANN